MSHSPDHIPLPWLLSADSAPALREKARRLDVYLRDREPALEDIGRWLAKDATVDHPHRAAVSARQRGQLLDGLAALARDRRSNGVSTGTGAPGDVAFVFPGAGPQWPGMAAELLDSSPVFRSRMDDCAQALEPFVHWSLIDLARDPGAGAELARADIVQPVLFAVMVSLAELWRSHGVEPAAVVGQSLGEVAAAAVSEALSLDDAARVAALWSRAQWSQAGRGEMVSVQAPADEVRERLAAWEGELVLAAINGPSTVLVSGSTAAAAELVEALRSEGVSARRTSVGLAAHSPQMDTILSQVRADLAPLRPRRPRLPFHSSLVAGEVSGRLMDADYWYDNIRRPVRFQETIVSLLASGRQVLLEVSPHPVLTSAMRDTIEHFRAAGAVVATLRRHDGGPGRLTAALGELWAAGARADWPSAPAGPAPADLAALWEEHASDDVDDPAADAPASPAADLLPEARRRPVLLDLVCAEVAAVLGREFLEPSDRRRPFLELGLDSVTAMEVRARIAEATGLPLPASAVFDHPTPAQLAAYLGTRAAPGTPPAAGAVPARRPAPAGEPVAIVGMGCRLPGGVHGPEDLWRLLSEGRDAVAVFPADRGWDTAGTYDPRPRTPGRCYQREGGFLQDAPLFDAEFFGISPREALAMDPQQRLLLETSWEALEAAGIRPEALHGSRTGVFTGLMTLGYGPALEDGSDLGGHVLTGTTGSIASGRVAYVLGLEGPAVTVDTACSSSLVALHLAVQSLHSGESDLALAGGVTVMPGLGMFQEFSQLGALAPDGRCKAFADTADGFGLAEGVGVLVLQRLSDARAQGRRVLAVVRGSAVNQDGASSGLTAPSGLSQQRVIREALATAGLAARDVDAVEAHGTGTTLGDLIEAEALLATYGQDRDGRPPVRLGTLKSNIGHTQAAAGVAGVIKMVLAMRHGSLPRTLHVDRPSSQVDWEQGRLELLAQETPWPRTDGVRRAGVSSFGMSGTNAHVVLESAAPENTPTPGTPGPSAGAVPWVLSGRTREAVRDQAARLLTRLEAAPLPDVADVGWSLVSTRSAFEHRAAMVGEGREELLAGLRALAAGEAAVHVTEGRADVAAKVAFVFPGQGSQWAGMARPLLDASPVFARAMAECGAALTPFVDWSLLDVVDDSAALERVDVVQPVLWAIMVSLAELWRSYGVEPAAVAGHSQGEIAAACVAGVLSLEDGARVVALRSRAIADSLAGLGGMVALSMSEQEAAELLGRWNGRLSLAAVNGPTSTVASGEASAVDELLAACETAGIRARRIPVDYASHSAHVERIRDRLLTDLAAVAPGASSVPVYSCTTGEQADTRTWDARYWYRNLRETVRFASASRALVEAGVSVLLEVSPHPVLVPALQQTLDEAGQARPGRTAVGTLRRGDGGPRRLLLSLAHLYTHGVDVRWQAVFPGAREVELPTYAFRHRRFWPETGAEPRQDAVDTEFWETVEREDTDAVADALGVTAEALVPVLPALSSWRARRAEASAVDRWRYRESWVPLSVPVGSVGSWLLVVPAGLEGGSRAVAVAGALGAGSVSVSVDAVAGCGDLAGDLGGLPGGGSSLAGVVVLAPEGGGAAGFVLTVFQAVLEAGLGVPVWAVTCGAVSVGAGDEVSAPEQGAVWGLGRVAALEHPGSWGGLVDLPVVVDEHAAGLLARVVASGSGEDQVAVRASGVSGRRLVRASVAGRDVSRWSTSGTALVTGGTGGLGACVARWLVACGAEHLVLVSRGGPRAGGAAQLRAELEAAGARVSVVACDVGDRDALARVIARIPDDVPLRTVVHAAGVVDDVPLVSLTPRRLDSDLAGKAVGAWHLDELTAGATLDAFVLFSSGAAAWGSGGQAGYAAANACLDALAAHRRARGRKATSIAWGAWDEFGLVAGVPSRRHQLSRLGVLPMRPTLAIAALQRVLDDDETTAVITDTDWSRFAPAFTATRPSPLLSGLPEVALALQSAPQGADGAGESVADASARRLAGLSEPARRAALSDLVRHNAAAVLGHAPGTRIDADQVFRALGFDSVTAVELRGRLVDATGLVLPTTLVFDYPTAARLTDHLASLFADTPAAPPPPPSPPPVGDDPVVIVGMACRYPGGVTGPADLWRLVSEGVDATGDFPADRGWDLAALYDPEGLRPGTTTTRRGGFLDGAGDFDAAFFGISPREALAMDPQQRLLLETSWEALEHAGIDPQTLAGAPAGVFVGAYSSGYAEAVGRLSDEVRGFVLTGTSSSVVSGRVAYVLGLEGPAVTVDTACSSSLVAMHLAAQALRSGECTLALAGGVTVMADADAFVLFSEQGGLAPDGRCKPFADAADGTGFAEGVGIVVLERLSDAQRNGHQVLAVLRASAVNQDGASNGLTAPSGPSQQRVIRRALAAAGLSADEVDAVEAHGTGTRLGDPIEAQAILAAYGKDRSAEFPLWLGSLKSNIGHTQAAAGVGGVIKMVLAMRHGLLPRTLHVDTPSSQVDWSRGRVALLTEPVAWPRTGRPRRAGVSSFGVSGTNAHVIVEAAPESTPVQTAGALVPRVVPWVLSGRTPEAVRDQAARLAAHVEADPSLKVADVGWSLLATRAALGHRAAVLGTGREELLDRLRGLAAGDVPRGVSLGTARPDRVVGVLFTGQGAQRLGMGRKLYAHSPVFAAGYDAVVAELDPYLKRPLKDVVWGDDAGLLDETGWAQPALFALEVALFRLLESWNLVPDALLGHSVGEIGAAHVAGILSLPDACRLIAARARLMQALPRGGAMLAVEATEAEAAPFLTDDVAIAAINTPGAVVLSGEEPAVAEVAESFAALGRRTRRLRVSHAFHSALMDPMLAEFERVLETLTYQEPRIAVVSGLTGAVATGDELRSPAYWAAQVRETVRFADGIRRLADRDVTALVEVGPDGVLSAMAADSCAEDTLVMPLLRKDHDESTTVTAGWAALHAHGVPVDRRAVLPEGRRVGLPTYAFQHRRFWPAPATTAEASAVDRWRYRESWVPLSVPVGSVGSWLLVVPAGLEGGSRAVAVAGALGAGSVSVSVDAVAGCGDLAGDLGGLPGGGSSLAGVVVLAPEGGGAAGFVLTVFQAVLEAGLGVPVWAVTCGAVSVGAGDEVSAPEQGAVWGLGRVAALEHPGSWGGLVDLPVVVDEHAAGLLARVVASGSGEDQVAVRASGVSGRRLVRASVAGRDVSRWSTSGTALVTGGTGGLGACVARWLVACGAEHLVLVSRRGPRAGGAAQLRAELEAAGARVSVVACDVGDRDALARVIARIPDDVPLRTVVHAAGVSTGTVTLESLTPRRLDEELAGKAVGAWHLDELTAGATLDAFVLFSSGAAAWGSGGQAGYAAANACLDALAAHRRARGRKATSIAWGAWSGAGMVGATPGHDDRLRRLGVVPMQPDLAVSALQQALDEDETTLVVADLDWPRFLPTFTATRPSPLLSALPEAAGAAAPAQAAEAEGQDRDSGLTARLADLSVRERSAFLVELVRKHAAEVLGHASAQAIATDQAFRDMGFDSFTAVELRVRLARATGLSLPATMVFDHPSALGLAAHLDSLLGGAEREEDTAAPGAPSAPAADDPIAIVGMACRYPGGVAGPEDLWRLVATGTDAITPFPADRGWDLATLSAPGGPGFSAARNGGFLRDAGEFDADFFGISPREALTMDPQQRLLLETSWEALERAGIDPHALRGSRAGVFVGVTDQGYGPPLHQPTEDGDTHVLTGTAPSVASGRVSYVMGLTGPALSVDTACSSSLVALHLAAQSLRRDECSLALAGGVTVMATPGPFVAFTRQGGLSPDGRCKSFGQEADGTGWSEGVGVLVLERLSDARRNGHRVLAVIRGSAVNQDGASNGLTAPNGLAQEQVIRQALDDAGLRPSEVGAVEAHGTGTRLGDPIEAQALLATYGQDRSGEEPLWLGSLKSNIGHAQAAAGVAGVIKMVKALEHGVLPPTLHAKTPTSQVDWEAGAVRLLHEARAWEGPLRAGVSAFGVSGTNAHLILEAAPDVPEDRPSRSGGPGRPVPWLVSAHTQGALRDQARALLDQVDGADVLDLGFSLATTRALLHHRAVVVARDAEGFRVGLAALAAGDPPHPIVPGPAAPGGLAFLFSGQGAQLPGMGGELAAAFPVFATAFAEASAGVGGVRVDDADVLRGTAMAQRALFAFQVALYRLWESWGMVPDAVIGHSVGEVAAAHVAGVLSLEDACRLVTARADLMERLARDGGAMVSVRATEEEVTDTLADGVCLAAVNGPRSVVLSGDAEAVETYAARWSGARRLRVSHAFHSHHMDRMLDAFAAVVRDLTFHQPSIPVLAVGDVTEPDHWVRQVREPVRFFDAVRKSLARGIRTFCEIGPDAVLTGLAQECADDVPGVRFVPSGRRGGSEEVQAVRALGELAAHGVTPRWKTVFPGARPTDLPTYTFQRRRYWLEPQETDSEFWTLVRRQDLSALTGSLRVDGDPRLSEVLPALARWHRRSDDGAALGRWRYELAWETVVTDPSTKAMAGTWLVVPSTVDDPLTEAVVTALDVRGAETAVVRVEDVPARVVQRPVAGVVLLLPAAGGSDATDGRTSVAGLDEAADIVDLTGRLAAEEVTAPLWFVTRGAVAVDGDDPVSGLGHSLLWGLGPVLRDERPELWGGVVDVPAVPSAAATELLVTALASGRDQLAVRDDGLHTRRLVRTSYDRPSWRPAGTVLVTGGTGALGRHVARWLAAEGAAHVVLAGRRGNDAPGIAELCEELTADGVTVTAVACDIRDRAALADLLDRYPPDAVVHAAAVVDDTTLEGLTSDRMEPVLRTKALPAWHLHQLTRARPLTAFVLFSSVAGTLGTAGQGNYAPGNAFLDALAAHRRALGLPATSIAWGPWAGDGLAAADAVAGAAGRHGMNPMEPALAVRGLAATEAPFAVVADVDWERFPAEWVTPAVAGLVPDGAAEPAAALPDRLSGLSESEQERLVLRTVRSALAAVLGHRDLAALGEDRTLTELGLDSMTAVELRNRLRAQTGLELSATLAYNHPTVEELTRHLHGRLRQQAAAVRPSVTAELDRLEAAVAALPPDADERAPLAERLRALLGEVTRAPAGERDLDQLTQDELLALIDDEFGR